VEPLEEVVSRRSGDRADRGAGDDETEGVDRTGGIRGKDDVARRGDRLGKVGEALLGPQGNDDFLVGVERDAEAALVIGRLRFPEARDATARRVTVRVR